MLPMDRRSVQLLQEYHVRGAGRAPYRSGPRPCNSRWPGELGRRAARLAALLSKPGRHLAWPGTALSRTPARAPGPPAAGRAV